MEKLDDLKIFVDDSVGIDVKKSPIRLSSQALDKIIFKINEIVEWINTQQAKIDLQDQYKQ